MNPRTEQHTMGVSPPPFASGCNRPAVATAGALLLALAGALAVEAGSSPRIPREHMSDSMPPEVREQVEKLYSDDDAQRLAGVQALENMGPAAGSAAPFLAAMLENEVRHDAVAWAAAYALVRLGDAAVEPTILAFQFGTSYGRMRALQAMTEMKDVRFIPVLVAAIEDGATGSGKDPRDSLHAIGERALAYVTRGLDDASAGTRYRSVLALTAFASSNTVATLSNALTDPDAEVRLAALRSLVFMFDKHPELRHEPTEPMLASVRDGDPVVRTLAVRILACTRGAASTAAITTLVNDPDRDVQTTAIQTLGSMEDDAATDALIALLDATDPWVRVTVAEALGRRQTPRAVQPLSRLVRDVHPAVRAMAIGTLGRIAAAANVEALLTALGDEDALVRAQAASALGNVRDPRAIAPLVAALDDPDKGTRLEVTRALVLYYTGELKQSSTGERRLPATADVPLHNPAVRAGLVHAMESDDEFARMDAFRALCSFQDPANVEVAVHALRDPLVSIRLTALRHLGQAGEPQDLSVIRGLLGDADDGVRSQAIQILGQRHDTSSFDACVQALVRGSRNEAASAAIALGQMGERAIAPLTAAMQCEEPDVRRRAAEALAHMNSARARQIVNAAIASDDPLVRGAAAAALDRMPRESRAPDALAELMRRNIGETNDRWRRDLVALGSAAVPPLIGLLGDADPRVRGAAVRSLGELRDPAAREPVSTLTHDTDPAVREAALRALVDICGEAAMPRLEAALDDPAALVREAATIALGRVGGAAAVDALASVATNADWHIRWLATESLGHGKSPRALPALVGRLSDKHWYVRRTAAEALAALGDKAACPELIKGLSDPHWDVRRAAGTALRTITGKALGAAPDAWQAWWQTVTD